MCSTPNPNPENTAAESLGTKDKPVIWQIKGENKPKSQYWGVGTV